MGRDALQSVRIMVEGRELCLPSMIGDYDGSANKSEAEWEIAVRRGDRDEGGVGEWVVRGGSGTDGWGWERLVWWRLFGGGGSVVVEKKGG